LRERSVFASFFVREVGIPVRHGSVFRCVRSRYSLPARSVFVAPGVGIRVRLPD